MTEPIDTMRAELRERLEAAFPPRLAEDPTALKTLLVQTVSDTIDDFLARGLLEVPITEIKATVDPDDSKRLHVTVTTKRPVMPW